MPKSGKKKKRSAKEDIYTKPLTALQRCYYQECTKAGVDQIDSVKKTIRNCLEGERGPVALEKLFVEPPNLQVLKAKAPKADVDFISEKPPPMSGVAVSECLPPLFNAIKNQLFTMIKEIHFWGFPISLLSATKFADTLAAMKYPLQVIEFEDCDLCPESINRLAISFTSCELLKSVSFDYNMLDLPGLEKLLNSLAECRKLLDVSLCYCGLDVRAGIVLGHFASQNVIRNLFLDGNDLEMTGIMDFFGQLMREFDRIDAQLEAFTAAESAAAAAAAAAMDMDAGAIGTDLLTQTVTPAKTPDEIPDDSAVKKKKKKKKRSRSRKKKLEEVIPPPGPWLRRIHLADTFGGFSQMEHYHVTPNSSLDCRMNSQALDCIKIGTILAKFIVKCAELEELDIYNNWLGNGAAAVLLDALEKREAAEMPRIGMRLNRGVEGALLKKLFKIASGVKKKKKRRKSSKKK